MNEDKNKRIILLLVLIAVIAIGIAVWALWFKDGTVVMPPDRVPAQESNIEKIPGDTGDKNVAPENGGSVTLNFSKDVTIDLETGNVRLYFANPNKSTHDAVVQIIIQDKLIAKTGAIEAGNQITELDMLEDSKNILSKGEYDGKFVVYFYDADKGEKDVLNTEIPINVKVN